MAVNDGLFRLSRTVARDPAIDTWFDTHGELGAIARRWFEAMRNCGDPDYREAMHDGCPTACLGDAAFAYVNAFKAHVNVGFFQGADLEDPARLLEGRGRRMRHVKVRPGVEIDEQALAALIRAAYVHMTLSLHPWRQ